MKLFLVVVFCMISTMAQAQTRLIVPFAQGGNGDQVARLIQKHLAQDINEKVLVEFAPGAAGEIGTDLVANSDTNELVLLMQGLSIFTTGIKKNKMDFYESRLQPVYHLGTVPFVLVVSKKLGVRNWAEFQALDPGRTITYGSGGLLSGVHIAGASLGQATAKKFLHVPYKGGGQAIPDLIAGHIDAMVIHYSAVVSLIQNDQLVALAVDSDRRIPALPQVPTLRELGLNRVFGHGWTTVMSNRSNQVAKLQQIQQSLDRFTHTAEYKDIGYIRQNRQPSSKEFYSSGIKTYAPFVNTFDN